MNLPKPELDKETAMQLWLTEHSDYAKEQLALNYVGLVGFVLKSMRLNVFDDDLYATGLVGIVKAVNTYNPDKECSFYTYAELLIEREISITFRKKRIIPVCSLDELCDLDHSEEVFYLDKIADKRHFEEEVIANIQALEIFNCLSQKEREIISLRIKGKTQKEVGEICKLSQAQVSRIIRSVYKKCKKKYLVK